MGTRLWASMRWGSGSPSDGHWAAWQQLPGKLQRSDIVSVAMGSGAIEAPPHQGASNVVHLVLASHSGEIFHAACENVAHAQGPWIGGDGWTDLGQVTTSINGGQIGRVVQVAADCDRWTQSNHPLHVVARSESGHCFHCKREVAGQWSKLTKLGGDNGAASRVAWGESGMFRVQPPGSILASWRAPNGEWPALHRVVSGQLSGNEQFLDVCGAVAEPRKVLSDNTPALRGQFYGQCIAITSTDRILHAALSPQHGWTGWGNVLASENAGGGHFHGKPARVACAFNSDAMHLFVVNAEGSVFHCVRWNNGHWSKLFRIENAPSGIVDVTCVRTESENIGVIAIVNE